MKIVFTNTLVARDVGERNVVGEVTFNQLLYEDFAVNIEQIVVRSE